jgi:hypothetical protein
MIQGTRVAKKVIDHLIAPKTAIGSEVKHLTNDGQKRKQSHTMIESFMYCSQIALCTLMQVRLGINAAYRDAYLSPAYPELIMTLGAWYGDTELSCGVEALEAI